MICDTPFYVLPKAGTEKVPVPCGRCPACKQRRVTQWVFRLLKQKDVSDTAHFVTLTYDTDHVPISKNGFMTLCRKDFQDYMKRLRKLCPGTNIKYYAVGEYGTNNNRPHYHAIIFGVDVKSKYFDSWRQGSVHVGDVTNDSIAYCMKYIDKKGYEKKFARDDRECEKPLMSKGLGKNYLTPSIISYHQGDISRMYVTLPGNNKVAMPRYYKERIYSEKQRKQQAQVAEKIRLSNEQALKEEYHSVYGYSNSYSYYSWLDSQKAGRFKNFQKHIIKKRDV